MDAETFEAALRRDGFSEIFRREIAPGNALPEHQHAWDARGLVLRGRFRVVEPGGAVQDCGPGELFELPIDALHEEAVGPDGAELLLGRRYKG